MVFVSTGAAVLTSGPSFSASGKTERLLRREPGMSTFRTPYPTPCGSDGPAADVVDWRRCRLIEAGFPLTLATVLARTRDVDVHALLLLVDRGCPPELAARILAPLGVPA
jgi:hypothetical protein